MAPSLAGIYYDSNAQTQAGLAPAIWNVWNQAYVYDTAQTVTSNQVIWTVWQQAAGGQQTASAAMQAQVTYSNIYYGQQRLAIRQETPEERQVRERLEAEQYKRQQEVRAKEQKIRAVARELLVAHLNRNQRQRFEAEKVFEVTGGSRKQRYLIYADGRVKRIDEQGPVESYCIHPSYAEPDHNIPIEDLILAKKLMLEFDEETFLKTANATRLRAA
jgi:hypothetical protein